MLNDAKNKIKSPDEFARKSAAIKANQLLGLEILSEVYMLAILNMILMGDGSSNILNKDSLKEFNGNYGFGKTNEKFPADTHRSNRYLNHAVRTHSRIVRAWLDERAQPNSRYFSAYPMRG